MTDYCVCCHNYCVSIPIIKFIHSLCVCQTVTVTSVRYWLLFDNTIWMHTVVLVTLSCSRAEIEELMYCICIVYIYCMLIWLTHRPHMTFTVDWALKINYLDYLIIYLTDTECTHYSGAAPRSRAEVEGIVCCSSGMHNTE